MFINIMLFDGSSITIIILKQFKLQYNRYVQKLLKVLFILRKLIVISFIQILGTNNIEHIIIWFIVSNL